MNRTILTSLVLPSVLCLAQAASAVEPKPITSSVELLAEAKQPAGLAEVALAAANPSLAAIHSTAVRAAVKETVHAEFTGQDFIQASLRQGGTLAFAMKGDTPLESTAPRVTRAVEVDLSPEELSQAPAVSNVVLHAIVDEHGIPRNVQVTKSAGAALDAKAVAALNQYRFTPATVDNQPTWSSVSVTIKIQK